MGVLASVQDAISEKDQRKAQRERFATAQRLEVEYARSLRYLTRQIDHIVKTMAPGGSLKNHIELERVLTQYAQTITPWAKSIAEKMIYRVAKKDEQAWARLGDEIGRNIRKEIANAPTGEAYRQFMNTQVELIKSLPLEAAKRVQELATGTLYESARAPEIARQVLRTGKISENKALEIARTEIARSSATLTMVRAQFVGVTHYVWRTSNDPDVRPSHKAMNGKIIAYDEPPEVDPGKHYHAGMFVNCRCYGSPIMPDLEF